MKPTWSDLTSEQQREYGNGCGLSARFLNVPDFIFTASCQQHDFNYERGGGLLDKIKADWDFFTHMLADSHRWWHYVVSVLYFFGVLLNPIAWLSFTYGRWRTIEEILERDQANKRSAHSPQGEAG
ncbi:hypothetical protein ACRDNQ_03985 [Palleronia sp. KMU-117]|uniref:hypothetical protein n=1 Tax=Palleronia sp. KMU-117 TaxID=3434108 RepID=UPI003D71A9EB